jgi:hypothetical protein
VSRAEDRRIAARHGERLPLPDVEAAALGAATELLATFRCPACGREWVTGRSAVMLWHSCPVQLALAKETARARRRHRLSSWLPPLDERLEEDRTAWAREKLGPMAEAFERAVDPEALYRPIEDQEG